MRRRRVITLLAIFVLCATAAFLARTKEKSPTLSITLLRYEKELAGFVTAFIAITNTGSETIYFYNNRGADLAWLTDKGWETNRFGLLKADVFLITLEPGAHSIQEVTLVSDLTVWKIAYEAQTPNSRPKLWNKIPP